MARLNDSNYVVTNRGTVVPDERRQSTGRTEYGVTRRSALKGVIAAPVVADVDSLVFSHGVVITPIEVDIDIKPGSDPNTINIDSNGTIPVAITGGDHPIDPVSDIDVDTLRFGDPDEFRSETAGFGAAPAHDGHVEDVNDDGQDDLVVHFPTQDTGFEGDEERGQLAGELHDGDAIFGSDSVRLIGR